MAALSACDDVLKAAPDVRRLAANVHVSIAEHDLVLPLIALENYAFHPDPERSTQQALRAVDKLLGEAATPERPKHLHSLSVVVRTYGWNDFDMRQRALCPLLTREWARSVCDNPWAAIQQALPVNRFKLVDLRDLQSASNCVKGGKPIDQVPLKPGQGTIICRAQVATNDNTVFHSAAGRISGQLGAIWTVWGHGHYAEAAGAMTLREGEAITGFVRHAIGATEDFAALHPVMCRLRRPGSIDAPHGADLPGPISQPRRADCPKE